MALIQCPECGKEMSDKVTACPHCGYPVTEQLPQPVEVTAINLSSKNPKKSKTLLICAIVAVGLIAIIVLGLFIKSSNDKKRAAQEALDARNAYIDNLIALRDTMITGAIGAEELCILTHDVWYDTIYKEFGFETSEYTMNESGTYHEDFNDSLKALYADEDTKATVNAIEANRAAVDELMRSLQNPTDEFSACYATADSMYDAYCGLTNLATSPTGSLTSYTESYRTYDTDFAKYYEKLATQVPEKQE